MAAKSKIIVISAPSGAGKTTLVNHLMAEIPVLEFSISATNRPPREGEIHGIDYYFFTEEEFKKAIREDKFIEWEEVYEGRYYGTLKSEISRITNLGKVAIFDIDVKGGLNLKKIYDKNAMAVFIQPPSIDELENRLRNRGKDSEQDMNNRIQKAKEEMLYAEYFDVVIINNDLIEAENELVSKVCEFLRTKLV